VEGSCEYGIEPSGSMKCWEVLEWLQVMAPEEGLSSVSKQDKFGEVCGTHGRHLKS
jgi:hypothetical protein